MPFRKNVSLGFFCLVGCLLPSVWVDAKPTGFKLRSGEALPPAQNDGSGALVVESGKQAAIDWESFSIGAGEQVRFQQFDGSSYVLNRVIGQSGSELLGRLSSNGAVYLINPNGILIGKDALIETAGFIASTLDLLDKDLSGELRFSGDSEAAVVNQGAIRCAVGDVFLIGRRVENSGTLDAPEGREGLLSGSDVLIRPEGAPQMLIRAEGAIDLTLLQKNPYAMAIRHSGESHSREAYLVADEGTCEVSGQIVAPRVRALATHVRLLDGTRIDASRACGGGEVLIGGDYQGKNPDVKNAKYVWVGSDVEVKADALEEGDGGKVIFWSDEATFHYGKISVRGGPQGGDGGFAEVSGQRLEYRGLTDARAPAGKTGVLLLDPNDVVIGTTATTGSWGSCTPPINYNFIGASATNYILNTDLQTQLASCNVTIDTTSATSTGSGPNSGSVTVSSAVSWSTANTLTLKASSFISIAAAVTCTSTSASQFTAMNFTADGTNAGANPGITLGSGGVLTSGGGSGAGDIILNGTSAAATTGSHGVYFNGGTIATYSGTISVTGMVPTGVTSVSHGVYLDTANAVQTIVGNITLIGSTASSSASVGVFFPLNCATGATTGTITVQGLASSTAGTGAVGVDFFGTLSASGANVSVVGTCNATGSTSAPGIQFFSSSSSVPGITTTNTGNITLNGTSGSINATTAGVYFDTAGTGSVVSTVYGAINIIGNCPGGTGSSSGVILGFVSPVKSTAGSIAITGTSSSSGTTSYGVKLSAAWTTGTTGTVTFSGTGGTGTSSHGVDLGGIFNSSGNVIFTSCLGGTNTTTAGNGVSITSAFSTSGSITATNSIMGGLGSGGSGFLQTANISSTGGGNITITAGSNSTTGGCIGIYLDGGTMSTSTGQITLNGTSGVSNSGVAGVQWSSTGVVSTTGINGNATAGLISVTALAQGTSGSDSMYFGGSSNPITSTYGQIQLTASSTVSTSSGTAAIQLSQTWTPGTTGTITISGTGSANGQTSHGFSMGSSFTGNGPVVFSNCMGGNNATSGGNGVNIGAAFTTTGSISTVGTCTGQGKGGAGFASNSNFSTSGSGQTISIIAAATGTTGTCHGISLTGGTLQTSSATGGTITLSGTGGASGTASHGINISTTAIVSTVTSNAPIVLTGAAAGTAAGVGINLASPSSVISTTGSITLTGTSVATAAGSHGVSINTSAWTTGTTGTVVFSGCSGSANGTSSHGVAVGATFSSSGDVVFTNCSGGNNGTTGGNGVNVSSPFSTAGNVIATNAITGQGVGGIGFASSVNFLTSGSLKTINIAATGSASGAGHGIALTAGTMQTSSASGGTITLNGTGGTSSTTAHGIYISGTGLVTTSTSNAPIVLMGTASGTGSAAGIGVNITGSTNSITSGSGTIAISGTSSAPGTGAHGVSINTNSWAAGTTGTITFSSCTATGAGNTSHGIDVETAFSTAGSVVATNSITGGSGTGSLGFNGAANFATTGATSTIQITATSSGATGAVHGISLSAGTLSSVSGTITLMGTSGASSTASYGVNLASAANSIRSGTGAITVGGTSLATVTGSHGVSINTNAWAAGTTGTVTFINCVGGNTGASHGLNVSSAFSTGGSVVATSSVTGGSGAASVGFNGAANFATTAANGTLQITATSNGATGAAHGISLTAGSVSSVGGAITLIGTSGASTTASYGINVASAANSVTSTSGAIALTGTSQSTVAGSNGVSINTNPWAPGTTNSLSITGTAGTTGASYGVDVEQVLTNTGPISFSGTSSGGTGSFGNRWNVNLTTNGSSVTTSGSTQLASAIVVDTTNGGGTPAGANIAFSGAGATIDGTQNLTLEAGSVGAVTFGGAIGQTTTLGALTITSAATTANAVNIANNITANSFTITTASPVTLTGSSIINVSAGSGGSISFPATIDGTNAGNQALTLTANTTGTVTLTGNVGSNVQLGAFTITGGTSGFSIGTAMTGITASSVTVGGTVPTTLNNTGALTINTNADASGSITFGGAITGVTAGAQALTLTANGTGTVTLSGNVGATRLGAFAIGAGTGALSIGTGVTSIAANSLTVPSSTTTTLNNTATLVINTSATNGAIMLPGTIDGAPPSGLQNLTLEPGTGNITLTGAVGENFPLGAILIPNATTVTTNSINAASFTQNAGVGTTTFNGQLSMTGNITMMGTNFAFNAPVLTANNVTITNSGVLSIAAAGIMTLNGTFTQSTGLVHTAGDIFTSSQNINFGGGVTLTGNVQLNTGGTAGTITFGSTVDGRYTLSLNAADIVFEEPVGGTPLYSLQATAAGSINIYASQTVSSGPMTYNGAVTVYNPLTFTNSGSSAMEFLLPVSSNATDSISGNYDVTLLAPSTSITVDGDINLSGIAGSSGTAGASLMATAGTGITLGGQVLTLGGVGSVTTGGNGGNVSLSCISGSVSVHNINVSAGTGVTTGGDGGMIDLSASSGYSGGYPLGIIILNSDLSPGADGNLVSEAEGGTAGTVTLSSNRASPATVATIASSLTGNDVIILAQTITVGPNEAMTILGDLEFVCSTVSLGDTVALDDLYILSETINLNLHGPYQILDETGLLYTTPTLHFLGGSGYVPIGALNPSDGALNGQNLGLSASTFRPLLIYNDYILNYDTSPRPTPFALSEAVKTAALYRLAIADAQLSDLLPNWKILFPRRFTVNN